MQGWVCYFKIGDPGEVYGKVVTGHGLEGGVFAVRALWAGGQSKHPASHFKWNLSQ